MNLKKFYKIPEGAVKHHTAAGPVWIKDGQPVELQLDYVAIGDTGVRREQNWSPKMVKQLEDLGVLELTGDSLILSAHPEPLVYKVLKMPGRYCLHCGDKLVDNVDGSMARAHVASSHPGEKSPDPENPSGYVCINAFQCMLDAEQHDKYSRKSAHLPVKYHVKGESNG